MGLGVEKAGYALAEFYLSLIAYYVLHMIFVISSDFVEAFNIPPLNIGIYVDKMAAIRALLMVIADLLEWAITQKWLGDPGQKNYDEAKDSLGSLKDSSDFGPKWYRRLGSLLSYFAMLVCRIVYIWLVYKSDNKSLSVFVTLCIEGFWFGVFQMSFFAVGPEFNAFTSFGIHTMGNFIFFTQVIFNRLSKKYPNINSLFRVRAHGWIVLVTSLIALPIWVVFCYYYSYGGGDSEEFTELVDELRGVSVNTSTGAQITNILEELAKAFKEGGTKFKELVTKLRTNGSITTPTDLTTTKLQSAIIQDAVKNAIADLVTAMYGATVNDQGGSKEITAADSGEAGDANKLKVVLQAAGGSGDGIANGEGEVNLMFHNNNQNKGVKVTIKISREKGKQGSLSTTSDNNEAAEEIARRIAKAALKAAAGGDYNPGNELLKSKMEFGLDGVSVTQDTEGDKVKVNAGNSEVNKTQKIKITGGGLNFEALVCVLSETNFTGSDASQIATALATQMRSANVTNLKDALTGGKCDELKKKFSEDNGQLKNADQIAIQLGGSDANDKVAQLLVKKEFGLTSADVTGNAVEVQINGGSTPKGSGAIVKVTKLKANGEPEGSENITITVKGDQPTDEQGQAIANALALALLDQRVAAKLPSDVKITLPGNKQPEVEIKVTNARSTAQANRIAFKLGSALEKVESVVITGSSGSATLKLSLSKENWMIDGDTNHVWSPLLLFIVGAFAEDFAVPGILPFAFLDPDKASLVNYLTPSFFMTGSMIIVFLNDIFEVKGFARDLGMSRFKEWSEGAADPWHGLWTLNLLKYTAFFIAMWSIHGTFDRLRCIIQSRWRVMLLTMFIVVPRATLEVAGYVGVANYAILASETSDYSGFDYIAYHDVLAMFCRFVYGKFAVGYKSTPKYSFWLKIHLNIMMWNIYSYCINIINDV